jgi:hypothetical protein
MKSFDQTFSKVCGLQGQSPWSRPQARNFPYGVFGSFCARGSKKNGEDFLT